MWPLNNSLVFLQCFGSVFQLRESGSASAYFDKMKNNFFSISAQVLVYMKALRLLLDHLKSGSTSQMNANPCGSGSETLGRLSWAWYLACTMREDWEESEEGGGTTGRATAVTIELLELYNREGEQGSHLVIKVVTLSSVYRSVVEPSRLIAVPGLILKKFFGSGPFSDS